MFKTYFDSFASSFLYTKFDMEATIFGLHLLYKKKLNIYYIGKVET